MMDSLKVVSTFSSTALMTLTLISILDFFYKKNVGVQDNSVIFLVAGYVIITEISLLQGTFYDSNVRQCLRDRMSVCSY